MKPLAMFKTLFYLTTSKMKSLKTLTTPFYFVTIIKMKAMAMLNTQYAP